MPADGIESAGVGSGAGVAGLGAAGKSVRVTGRDQSQTLGELLLFILQTFSKFFWGISDPADGQGVGEASCGGAAMSAEATAGNMHGLNSLSGDGGGVEEAAMMRGGGFPGGGQASCGDGKGGGEERQGGGLNSLGEVASVSVEPGAGLSPSAFGAWSDTNRSSNSNSSSSVVVACPEKEECEDNSSSTIFHCIDIDPGGAASGAATRSSGNSSSTAASAAVENVEPESPTTATGGDGGPTSFNASVCPGGGPATMSARGGDEWPQLSASPGGRRRRLSELSPSASSAPPAAVAAATTGTPGTPVKTLVGEESDGGLALSPAGATITGLRELEEKVASSQPNAWAEGSDGIVISSDSAGDAFFDREGDGGDGVVEGAGVWGGHQGGAAVLSRLAWDLDSPVSGGRVNTRVEVAATTRSSEAPQGPARALRFTDDSEEVGGRGGGGSKADGNKAVVCPSPSPLPVAMPAHMPNDERLQPATTTASGPPLRQAPAVENGDMSPLPSLPKKGDMFDEWTPSVSVSVPVVSPEPASGTFLPPESEIAEGADARLAAVAAAAAVDPNQPGPAPTTSARGDWAWFGDAPPGTPGLPALALKEAARCLCNLYACHGAPAAGGEAAAAADLPERLQPLATIGSILCQIWPPAAAILMRRLLGTWPTGSSKREVAYLRLIAGVTCAAPSVAVMCPGSRVPLMLFRRMAQCINSPNTKVRWLVRSLEVLYVCQRESPPVYYLLEFFLVMGL